MDTQQLELFMDLVKTGSFSETAKKNFRTQPAISITVKKLEEELGVRLIERSARRSRLTPEGEMLKKQMTDILRLFNDLKFQASILGKTPKGRIRIATIHSVGLYEINDAISLFIKKYRDIRLDLRYESFQKIYELVEKQEVDFGIVAYPVTSSNIEVIPMRADDMVIISPPESELKNRVRISLSQLNGMNFVAFSDNVPTRKAIDETLKKSGTRVKIRFENENIETLKKAVDVGLGVAILPLKTIEKDEQSSRFHVTRISGTPLKRPIGILKAVKHPLSKISELFIKELLKNEN